MNVTWQLRIMSGPSNVVVLSLDEARELLEFLQASVPAREPVKKKA